MSCFTLKVILMTRMIFNHQTQLQTNMHLQLSFLHVFGRWEETGVNPKTLGNMQNSEKVPQVPHMGRQK